MTGVTGSGGDVFADLELADPDGLALRAELTRRIVMLVRARALSQRAAARLLGLRRPDVSPLLRGRWTRFSTDQPLR
jgi:predicted XRE-type DNA-binding protein